MTVVVTVPGRAEPWKVSNAAFRLLAEEVKTQTPDSGFMTRAAAMHGLHLAAESDSERRRIAEELGNAARSLRARLKARGESTEWEMSLAGYLPVLEMWMDGLVGDAD